MDRDKTPTRIRIDMNAWVADRSSGGVYGNHTRLVIRADPTMDRGYHYVQETCIGVTEKFERPSFFRRFDPVILSGGFKKSQGTWRYPDMVPHNGTVMEFTVWACNLPRLNIPAWLTILGPDSQ